MKRVLFKVPENFSLDNLTAPQLSFVQSQFTGFLTKSPVSISFGGFQMADAIAKNSLLVADLILAGINWPIIFLGTFEPGQSDIAIVVPLDQEAYKSFNPNNNLTELHQWAGWPDGEFTDAFSTGFQL